MAIRGSKGHFYCILLHSQVFLFNISKNRGGGHGPRWPIESARAWVCVPPPGRGTFGYLLKPFFRKNAHASFGTRKDPRYAPASYTHTKKKYCTSLHVPRVSEKEGKKEATAGRPRLPISLRKGDPGDEKEQREKIPMERIFRKCWSCPCQSKCNEHLRPRRRRVGNPSGPTQVPQFESTGSLVR